MSDRAPIAPTPQGAHAVLVVDDEPPACKWFARLYGNEFVVLTAGSVNEALALLEQRGHEVAVLLAGGDWTAAAGAPVWRAVAP